MNAHHLGGTAAPAPKSAPSPVNLRAFTLIELLVVIAIIAILAEPKLRIMGAPFQGPRT